MTKKVKCVVLSMIGIAASVAAAKAVHHLIADEKTDDSDDAAFETE